MIPGSMSQILLKPKETTQETTDQQSTAIALTQSKNSKLSGLVSDDNFKEPKQDNDVEDQMCKENGSKFLFPFSTVSNEKEK